MVTLSFITHIIHIFLLQSHKNINKGREVMKEKRGSGAEKKIYHFIKKKTFTP